MANINIDITGNALGTTWQTKQDKIDQNINDPTKTVVGALNNANGSIAILSSDVDQLNTDVGVLLTEINNIKAQPVLNPPTDQQALQNISITSNTTNGYLISNAGGDPITSITQPKQYTTKAFVESYPILATKTKADNLLQIDQYNTVSANGCLQVKNATSFASDPKDYTSKAYVDSKTSSWIQKGTSTNAKTWTWPLTVGQYYRVWYNLGSSTTTDTLMSKTFLWKGQQIVLDQYFVLTGTLITSGIILTAGTGSGTTITITNIGTGTLGFINKLEESPTLALFGDPKGEPENA